MSRPAPQHSFQLRHVFDAPREAVFRAWTDASALQQWFRPAGHQPTAVTIDLRVDGALHIDMQTEEGAVYHFSGEFEVVQPPEKLVLTWFCSLHDYANTHITLEFHDLGASTEVVLTHGGFADEVSATDFMNGWPPALTALADFILSMEDHRE